MTKQWSKTTFSQSNREINSVMDLSIFKNEKPSNCVDGDYANCATISRLVVALKYYAALKVKDDKNDQEIFRSFMQETYRCIVDDNNHFMTEHSNHLNEICDILNNKEKCTMKGCSASQRHFMSEKSLSVADDHTMNFYVNMMDSLHFIICHSYDCGMRVKKSESEHMKRQDEDAERTLFDAEFARINAEVRKTDLKTSAFDRISQENNAKFTLSNTGRGDTTFLDELYKHLSTESVNIGELKAFIDTELYDSESIKIDVSAYGNIQMYKESILGFTEAIRVQSNTFSVGLRFYYWKYFQNKDELPRSEQMVNAYNNKHDHGGYKVSDLYIKPKFSSFKEEVANYPNLNILQYEEAMMKANQFMLSRKIRTLYAKYTYHDSWGDKHMFLHYGIAFGTFVSVYHILSLIFYTDYSKLSTAFSSTSRKIHNFETLKSIKRRNALYCHMSKYLRELVELFGQCSYGDTFKDGICCDRLTGPFYCGMNYEMNVGSFAMRLNSPSSTSKQLAVAIKFSGPLGVVFTFDTPKRDIQYKYLRSFVCSHISRFPEEDECLFFGGFYRIKVVNLRLMKTKENMKIFVAAIFEFDKALTGGFFDGDTKNGFIVIDNLIKTRLVEPAKNVTLPRYILDCFQSFCENKQQIIFDMDELYDNSDERINKLLFHSMNKRLCMSPREFKRTEDDLTNMVRSELFVLFPNVQSLIIDTNIAFEFCISLMALWNIIIGTNLNEVTIKSGVDCGRCWINSIWKSDEKILKKKYGESAYNITMENPDEDEYNLIINKLQSVTK